MNASNVYLHTASGVNKSGNAQVFREGSQVLVRIAADKGNGKYEGFVGGVKVNLSANKALTPGTTFTATIGVKNGTIQIIPKAMEVMGEIKNLGINFLSLVENSGGDALQAVNNQQLAAYLQSIGLPPDNLSVHLFQQMKQLGLKYDAVLMKKLHLVAQKFKGKEKSAGEMLLLLLQKGIDLEEDELIALLAQLEYKDNQNNSDFNHNSESDEAGEVIGSVDFKNFINKLFTEQLPNKIGLLTLMNHLGWNKSEERKENGSWCFLPFEIDESEEASGKGNIGLFLDSGLNLKSIIINCGYENRDFHFALNFENKAVNKARVNFSPATEEEKEKLVNELKRKLIRCYENAKVFWCEKEELEGTACGSEDILRFRGTV